MPRAFPDQDPLFLHNAVALAGHQRPSPDPFGARAAATLPSGAFVNQLCVRLGSPVNLNPSPGHHRFI